jgi:hypothetical protein
MVGKDDSSQRLQQTLVLSTQLVVVQLDLLNMTE